MQKYFLTYEEKNIHLLNMKRFYSNRFHKVVDSTKTEKKHEINLYHIQRGF